MMEAAKTEVCRHLDLLQPLRPRRGFAIARMFGREDVNMYTDEELIAELNYAEALIDFAIFTFLNGQSILTLIKAALKMNSAYNILKFCHDAYKNKNNWKEIRCRDTFEAGVLNAMGITNLVLSNLPTSILKLLSLAGMSGNRDLGIEYLKRVSHMVDQPRIHWNFCMILGYTIYLEQMLGFSEYSGQMFSDWADEIATRFLNMYPNGAVPLFLNARVALLRSEPKRAIILYKRCLAIQNDWKQIDLFCIFDLVWAHAILMDWGTAAKYCDQLLQTCTWGHAINMHLFACLKWMHNMGDKDENVKEEIIECMSKVEGLRKRYAGRSYPAEKLAVERAKRFLANGNNQMTLPMFELFHVWNVFAMMKRDPQLIQAVVDMIDDKLKNENDMDLEDKAVMTFLKGVCAKYLRKFEESIDLLNHAMKLQEASQEKSFVVPHALMEIGLVHKELGNLKQSRNLIEQAKTNKTSSKYMLEALVQLKAHSVLRQLDQLERES
jgi:tetratricopeptide (TPR) repeat protein